MDKKEMDKRGISAVVATVLIILITVAAVTIIWAAIIPMIKQQTEASMVCQDAISQVSIESEGGYTCYDDDGTPAFCNVETCGTENNEVCTIESDCEEETDGDWTDAVGVVKVQVSRGAADFNLAGVQIIISEEGDTNSTEETTAGKLPGVNEEKVINVEYINTTTAGPDKVLFYFWFM
jgi:FlaG/FlaF family flagellin (archaellin)